MLKKLLLFYAIEIKLSHAIKQYPRFVLENLMYVIDFLFGRNSILMGLGPNIWATENPS